MHRGKIEQDFTSGPIFKQMLLFALPLMFSNVLQILFNTADIAVLGALVDDVAVAGVGSTSSLINLITSMFIGVAVGVNVIVSKYLGAHNEEGVKKVVGMSILLSFVFGAVLVVIGWFGARTFLVLMKSNEEVIGLATTYLKVYFLGIPLVILYNFLSAILRAAGDSKRPLIYLLIGGVVNIVLNVFFITVFNMTVEGVAIATVVAQGVSALLCFIQLIRAKGVVSLSPKHIKFYKKELLEVIKVGVPAGIQSSLFSLSNVIIQSSINVCGKAAVSGSAYAQQIEAYIYCAMHGISLATMSIVSQNFGAKKIERIKKIILYGLLITSIVGISLGALGTLLCNPILSLITDDKEVIGYALERLLLICLPYVLCGVMEIFSYSLRAMGKNFLNMIICLIGACLLRIVWIELVFKAYKTYRSIFVSYPISWFVTVAILLVFLIVTLKQNKNIGETPEKEVD